MDEDTMKAVNFFRDIIITFGGQNPSSWCACMADNVDESLKKHNLDPSYIKTHAIEIHNPSTAQTVQNYLVETLHFDGIPEVSNQGTKYVYIYKKWPHTSP